MGFLLQIPHNPNPSFHPVLLSIPTNSKTLNVKSTIFKPYITIRATTSMPSHCAPISISSPPFPATRKPNLAGNRPVSLSGKFTVKANSDETLTNSSKKRTKSIIICSIITTVLGVSNRVLYKLALVPLKEYPFFLAQFITFGYVAIYFSILFIRHRAGIVTDEMLAVPKSLFVFIGFLEALGVAAGMSAAAVLPGPAIPILNQTFLVWQLLLSSIILGTRYSFRQIVGCLFVATGVVVAVSSGSNGSQLLSGVKFIWPALMVSSSAVQAGASILKEFVFRDAATRLKVSLYYSLFKGKTLGEVFIVNSFGSAFQALFVLLFLPFLSNMKGIPFTELPQYLKSGVACFLNIGATTTGCEGAPLLPLLYVINNIAFNIAVLSLLKISSAVIASLVVMVSVPIAIYILSLPLPYLPGGSSLSQFFVLGSVILMAGLILYNLPKPSSHKA